MYFSYIHSRMVYMSSIWSAAPKYLTDSIDILQRKALRIVFVKPYLCSRSELYSENILPASISAELHTLLLVFKMHYRLLKNNFLFTHVHQVNPHSLRNSKNFIIQSYNTELATKNFYIKGPKLFNDLPESFKAIRSLSIFKNKLREHYVQLI